MLETNHSNLDVLKVELKKLVKSTKLIEFIYDKAVIDNEFAKHLEEILLTDKSNKVKQTTQIEPDKSVFDTIRYLSEHGDLKMRIELQDKTTDDLKQIFRAGGSRKSKKNKNIEREQLIEEIIQDAQLRLNRGSSFL